MPTKSTRTFANSLSSPMNFTTKSLTLSVLFLTFSLYNTAARKLIVLITDDDLIPTSNDAVPDFLNPNPSDSEESDDNPISDPGSWGPVFDPGPGHTQSRNSNKYYAALAKMSAAASGEVAVDEAVREFEALAGEGCGNAQSVLGFLYGSGIGRKRSAAKAWLYHWFAAEDGSLQSMMALAYMYSRQHMYEKAVKLYAVLAEVAVNSILISKDSLLVEPVRIHIGAEENKEALMMLRGEDDDNFQIFEYEAHKGNARSMYKIGLFYYFGLRGLRCDHAKALSWFLKAAERGEPKAMELLGEIYFRGAGVDKNYSEAFKWLQLAAKHLDSAYNLIGYMHVKGYGVENKNHTKAKEYFEKAASGGDAEGYYNLGLMYLKGMGVKRNVNQAFDLFMVAANAGKSKAIYQLAKMFQTGVVLRKNLPKAIALYKLVAERGPWRSFSRWALDSYLKGDIATALLLYLRMAELGYEVAQSNAAWILDKYGERSMCMGESGFCTNTERHNLAHSLWWQASEQGNEEAALLLGDAYYYGRTGATTSLVSGPLIQHIRSVHSFFAGADGTERNYDRAVEAYMHAKSHSNAQAIFNLGYMYEHGQGLPYDLHLAKRYYDQALQIDPDAKFPVTLALASLWMRNNHADSFLVHILDSLPDIYPRMIAWIEHVLLEEGNATILALFVCLLTVLYLRQLRHAVVAVNDQPLRH